MGQSFQQSKMKLVENLTLFTETTSIHGLHFIAKSTLSTTVRCTWVILFLFSFIYAAFMISDEAKGKKIFILNQNKDLQN